MSPSATPDRWWRAGTATTVGSWSGEDPFEIARIVAGETPLMPALPELPGRGAGADMIGRTLALLPGLPAEVVPSGWRFTAATGPDHRRANAWLRQDLDAFEEAVYDCTAPVKLQVTGPFTLASAVELASGERAISDHGARADLAEAVAETARDHVAEVRRRLPAASTVVLQIDEPAIGAVRSGSVPTASGYRTYRSVDGQEIAKAWRLSADTVRTIDAQTVLHTCAPNVPFDLVEAAGFDGLSIDGSTIAVSDYDALGSLIDRGTALFLGCVPSDRAPGSHRQYTDRLQRWWRDLGFAPAELAARVIVTPSCGMAGLALADARRVVKVMQDIVGAVVEDPEGDHAQA